MGKRISRRRARRGRMPAPAGRTAKASSKSGSVWTHLGIAIAFWTIVSTIGYMIWTCRGASIGI